MITAATPTVAQTQVNIVERFAIAFCAVCALLLTWMAVVNASYCVDNVKLIDAFETDEALITKMALENHREHNFDPKGFFAYPYLYHEAGLAAFRYAELLGYNIDSRFVAVTYRTLSIISAVVCVATLILLVQLFGVSLSLAALGGLFLFTIPDFYYWSQMQHPDILQCAFVLLGFYAILRSHEFSGALLGAICFGAAFSVKYAGLLALPFAIVPYAFAELSDATRGTLVRKILRLLAAGLLLCVAFAEVFTLTNPYAVEHFSGLTRGITSVKNVVAGVTTINPPNEPLTWVQYVAEFSGVAAASFFMTGITFGLVVLGSRLYRAKRANRWSDFDTINRTTILAYVIFGFVIQYLMIDKQSARYSFYFVPILILLATVGMNDYRRMLGCFSPVLVLALIGMTGVRTDFALRRMTFANNKPIGPVMELTAFVENRYKHTDMIVAESGVYVPPVFTNSRMAWGITQQTLDNLHPDVLIFKKNMSGRWAWKRDETTFAEKDIVAVAEYGDRSEKVKQLLLSILNDPDWKIVYELGEFVVFENGRISPTK